MSPSADPPFNVGDLVRCIAGGRTLIVTGCQHIADDVWLVGVAFKQGSERRERTVAATDLQLVR